MQTITRKINTYSFGELSPASQDTAINNYIRFVYEVLDYDQLSPAMQTAVNKANAMLTPWFVGSYILDYAKNEIIESLQDYTFLSTGAVFTPEPDDSIGCDFLEVK